MAAVNVIRGASILLGKCVPSAKQNASKIRITRMILDENLLMVSVHSSVPESQKYSSSIVFRSSTFESTISYSLTIRKSSAKLVISYLFVRCPRK